MKLTRRTALLSLAASLGGCGFTPLYAPGGNREALLSSIFVDPIANRNGQLLRQALQARLDGSQESADKKFVLGVYYIERGDGIGVQSDNSTTRNRDTGTASWALHRVGVYGPAIASGTAQALDGYNIIDEQFFYSTRSPRRWLFTPAGTRTSPDISRR
jgi:LPS-assembly lipoprotein